MKSLAQFEKDLGNNATAKIALGVEAEMLKLEVSASLPIATVLEPATKALDQALDKLKAMIPGTWDDAQIDAFKVMYKAELIKALAE